MEPAKELPEDVKAQLCEIATLAGVDADPKVLATIAGASDLHDLVSLSCAWPFGNTIYPLGTPQPAFVHPPYKARLLPLRLAQRCSTRM
eukprot:SAG22_NODE_880_length_6703_cov_8.753786_4_plen_89_part_00